MAGVDENGITIKTLADILADIEARQLAAPELGPAYDNSPASAGGQLNATIASGLAECWELALAVYQSGDVHAAQRVMLDIIGALTGSRRRSAAGTRVEATLTLDVGADPVPVGAVVAVEGREDLTFELQEQVEHSGGLTVEELDGVFVCTEPGPIAVNAGIPP